MRSGNRTSRTAGALSTAGAILSATALAAATLAEPARAELTVAPKQVGASMDLGQIKSGKIGIGDAEDQVLSRTGVYLSTSGTYNRKLELRMTIGGLFWYPLPEGNTPERILRFGPGVGEAQAKYHFGPADEPTATLQMGLFPLKYNADATNLGEYLFRSGTYPGYIWTGGWSYLNSAAYLAQGLRFSFSQFDGVLKHDFSLLMERDIEPTGDFSPGYVVTFKPSRVLELGAGAVWSHGLSLNGKRLSPESRTNAYVTATKQPLSLIERNKPGYEPGNPAVVPDSVPDPVGGMMANPLIGQPVPGVDNTLYVSASQNGIPNSQLSYYTFRGFKTMVRAALDLGALIGSSAIRPSEFRLYGEMALLGVENQPFYYEHRDERMPVMAGISLPTFGLFDRLAVEAEYHKSRFENTVGLVYDRELPLPLNSEAENPFAFSDSAVATGGKTFTRDDWHWSVYASRQVTEGIKVCGQVASDYMRQFGPEVKPTERPTTIRPQDWYYVIRLEFGLY